METLKNTMNYSASFNNVHYICVFMIHEQFKCMNKT